MLILYTRRLWNPIIRAPRNRVFPTIVFYPLRSSAGAKRCSYSSMARFTHTCDILAEPLHRYQPGGYHPVQLGDLFQAGRYKIVHKLGWGGWSTTWVARDQLHGRFVALKVCVSERTDPRESHVLEKISTLPRNHPGQAHLVQMLDYFIIDGPNGTHSCVVLELLGPNVPDVLDYFYNKERLPAGLAKSIAYQTLLGIDFLQKNRIGHGDLHTRNVVFMLPSLASLEEPQLIDTFGEPETAIVRTTDGKPLTSYVPPYLVRPASFTAREMWAIRDSPPTVKIIDFGESFLDSQTPTSLHTPLAVRPPEVIFGDPIDYRADIWSMGCMLFELVTGRPPFDTFLQNPVFLVSQMMELSTDKLPNRWQEKWQVMTKTKEIHDNPPTTLLEWLEEAYYFHENKVEEFTKQDLATICEFVSQMLKFEPGARASPSDILNKSWFMNCRSLPS